VTLLIILIAVALVFDFLNGLHDAANSIATIVSTRVLAPRYAVIWAAFFNFVAFLIFGLHVASTVGSGIVDVTMVTDRVILGALGGAISWNLITWYAGIPSSSSHALIGGLLGAGIAKAGLSAIVWPGVITTSAAIVLSPALGFGLGLLLMLAVSWIFVRSTPHAVDRLFRGMQFVSASLYSLGHGGNDAQKTMGIIAVLLYAHGAGGGAFHVPLWVVLSCQTAMALGTLLGGWRIVHTMGSKITRLSPMQGFCAETGGAVPVHRVRDPGLDHPYHHRGDHRRRRGQARVGGALEHRPGHRGRLGGHDAGRGPRGGPGLRRRRLRAAVIGPRFDRHGGALNRRPSMILTPVTLNFSLQMWQIV
jgi:PiT family inorganic phosphate transporter